MEAYRSFGIGAEDNVPGETDGTRALLSEPTTRAGVRP